jgi:hemerythrin
MERSGFPGLAKHRIEHHSMLAQMLQAAHRVQYGPGMQMQPLLSSLRDGYIEHIEGPDQEYGPWLNQHGVH